jgi:NTE family protein
MTHLMINISLKGWVFSGDIQSYLLSDYTKNLILFIAKGDFGVAATIFKNATIKIHTEAGFPLAMVCLF